MPTGQSSSRVFGVVLPEAQRIVIKLNAQPQGLSGMAGNLTALAALGLPVPRLLGADLEPSLGHDAWVMMDWLPGCDLRYELAEMSEAQMRRLARQLVDFQRRVASLPDGTGFGWVPIGVQGDFASWSELIERDLGTASALLQAAGHHDAAEGLQQLVAAHEAEFRRVRPRPFLDDLTTKNVLLENGRLSGLVDFDVICYGDRLYWLALTRAAVLIDVGEEGQPYLEALERALRLTAQQRRRCATYTLLHMAEILGRTRHERQLARIERQIAQLRSDEHPSASPRSRVRIGP